MERYRTLILIVVVIAIAGTIYGLEQLKPRHAASLGNAPDAAASASSTPVHSADYEKNLAKYPKAKELVSPDGYINTGGQPITIGSQIGNKVVLVDFWTYSCINCQRTIPYLEAWYKKYKDSGLVIVGVHTPEFAFEKELANVQAAVTKFGITYPVALDSDYETWDAYKNRYWPAEYLIDVDGLVREQNIGEGHYAETEQAIQKLLVERNKALGITTPVPSGLVNVSGATIEASSPETYFNYSRNDLLGNGTAHKDGVQAFTLPTTFAPNSLYLGGSWDIKTDYAQNTTAGASIVYTYTAKDVYFVASAPSGARITVLRDGQPVGTFKGDDVDASGMVSIKEPRLYKLIHETTPGTHTLKIIVEGTGLQAFTFTFG